MRIVYKLTSGAVLMAGESADGDTIVNPTAVQIFPGYNPALHGNFAVNTGLPSDLRKRPSFYQVDNTVTPTTVISKFHIEVTAASYSLVADGISKTQITIEVKNASGGTEAAPRTVNVSTTAGFLSKKQVTVYGVNTEIVLTSGLDTVDAIVAVADNDVDVTPEFAPTPGLIGGQSPSIVMSANIIITGPLAGLEQSSRIVRTAKIYFNDGLHHLMGIGNLTVQGILEAADVYGGKELTAFRSNTGVGDRAGLISSTFGMLTSQSFQSLFFDLRAGVLSPHIEAIWLGMFTADPTNTTSPTNCFGFRAKNGVDTNWAAYYQDVTITIDADTGIPIYSGNPVTLEIRMNHTSGMLEFWVNGFSRIQILPGAMFGASRAGLVASTWNLDVAVNPAQIDFGLIELKYT
jgi:hypothetical protein